MLTKSLEALGTPALKSSSPLIECDLEGTVGPEGEVERRSTRFFGRIPSFAARQLHFMYVDVNINDRWTDLDQSFLL